MYAPHPHPHPPHTPSPTPPHPKFAILPEFFPLFVLEVWQLCFVGYHKVYKGFRGHPTNQQTYRFCFDVAGHWRIKNPTNSFWVSKYQIEPHFDLFHPRSPPNTFYGFASRSSNQKPKHHFARPICPTNCCGLNISNCAQNSFLCYGKFCLLPRMFSPSSEADYLITKPPNELRYSLVASKPNSFVLDGSWLMPEGACPNIIILRHKMPAKVRPDMIVLRHGVVCFCPAVITSPFF